MIKIDDKPTVFFDVDDTLVLWRDKRDGDEVFEIEGHTLVVSKEHLRSIKEHYIRGHPIVVWSQGGSDWAEAVVNALNLQKYVDIVISKPRWFYDDLPSSIWMSESERVYKEPVDERRDSRLD